MTDFLHAVLPPEGSGLYCAAELKNKRHYFHDNFEALTATAERLSNSGLDAYFCVSSLRNEGSREASNSLMLKSVFIDIDCGKEKAEAGKGYATQELGVAALQEFVSTLALPRPYVIDSGYGLHVYWTFDDAVPVEAWRLTATALKRATIEHKLLNDYGLVANSVCVLRFPGTTNFKHGGSRLVAIRSRGDSVPFEQFSASLQQFKAAPRPQLISLPAPFEFPSLGAVPEHAMLSGKKNLPAFAEITESSFTKLLELRNDGCMQIQYYKKYAKQEGMEPLWRGIMTLAKNCTDGEQWLEPLANRHPYDLDRARRKWDQISGPHKCETLDTTNPGTCSTCKHYGKITSPLQLCKVTKEPEPITFKIPSESITPLPPPPVSASSPFTEAPSATSATPQEFSHGTLSSEFVPFGFRLYPQGVMWMKKSEDGETLPVQITDTPVAPTGWFDRNGVRYIEWLFVEHGEQRTFLLEMEALVSRDSGVSIFARNGIIVRNNMDAGFKSYVRGAAELIKHLPPQRMPTNYGWQPDGSFAYGGNVYTESGRQAMTMIGFENVDQSLKRKGTIAAWQAVVQHLEVLGRWDLLSMVYASAAAPLMKFIGFNGVTIHLCSNDSGLGKTQAQRLASSVWGHPDEFRLSPQTTANAFNHRLGTLGSLPMMVDEITHTTRNKMDWFPEFVSTLTDGMGKDRMEQHANAERLNTTRWSTIALMTSNKCMVDYMLAERQHGSEGELRRFIEIPWTTMLHMDDMTKYLLIDVLKGNFGWAGDAFIQWIMQNKEKAEAVTKKSYSDTFKAFEATGDERYWVAGSAVIAAAARLMKMAGITNTPVRPLVEFMFSAVKTMRIQVSRYKREPMDIVNAFTQKNYGRLVMVNNRTARLAGIEIAETLDRSDLCGRVERGATDGMIDYYIEVRSFRAFCSSLSYSYQEFIDSMKRMNTPVTISTRNLLRGTRGPTMSVKCLMLQLPEDVGSETFNRAANDSEVAA